MAFWARAPDPRLAAVVEQVCFSTSHGLPFPNSVRVVPDGRVDLIFAVEAVAPSAGDRPCRGTVFGAKTRALVVRNRVRVENVHLSLRPGAARRVFGVPARELTDAAPPVELLWGGEGRELEQRLGAAGDLLERGAILERALLRRLDRGGADPAADCLHAAVSLVTRAGGRVAVGRLAEACGVGERRLERLFADRVGLGPKRFARVVRFQRAYRRLRRGEPQAQVALACGYFDQAHLLRDFRTFAGAPPRRVLASDPSNPGDVTAR